MNIRKIQIHKETVQNECGQSIEPQLVRIAAIALVENPLAGQYADDLTVLYDMGRELGVQLSKEITDLMPSPVTSYGKAAIVGVNGDPEHGHALIHPTLGAPMREAIGGGKALIPSTVKLAGPGTAIDMPLGQKDDPWSFDHFDCFTLHVADGPRPNEIAVIAAMSNGTRPNARIPRPG